MTTVIFSNDTFYSDGLVTAGDDITCTHAPKMFQVLHEGIPIAHVGHSGAYVDQALLKELVVNIYEGVVPSECPRVPDSEALIYLRDGRLLYYQKDSWLTYTEEQKDFISIGSGSCYAMLAYKLGKKPKDCIIAASWMDTRTNDVVFSMKSTWDKKAKIKCLTRK